MADGADFRKAQKGKALQEAYWAQARRRTARRRADRGVARIEARAPARGAARPRRPVLELSESDRLQIVNSLIALLGGLYAHLPLKRAMYAIDPLQRLRLLARRAADMEESAFHHELEGIITRLRDAHTRYVGPARLQDSIARLPFLVEAYGDPTRYIVSRVASNRSLIRDRHFAPGVELLWWNECQSIAPWTSTPSTRQAAAQTAVGPAPWRALPCGPCSTGRPPMSTGWWWAIAQRIRSSARSRSPGG